MRQVFPNDQTQEFKDSPKVITLLGELILNGGPYTNPKEAVDKKYVDDAFKNITETTLVNQIPADKYPAFTVGDLLNKQGTNNFVLAEVFKEQDKSFGFTVDNKGRVIGASTGKFKFNMSDFDTIDFGKIIFPDTGSITDYIPNFNFSEYLTLKKDNVISKDLKFQTKELRTGDNVLSLDEVMTVSEDYFVGNIGGLKRDGLDRVGIYVDNINSYKDTGARPDLNQRIYAKATNNQINSSINYSIDIKKDFMKDPNYDYNGRPVMFVNKNYLYVIHLNWDNYDKGVSFRLKLDNSGRLIKPYVTEELKIPPIDGYIVLNNSWTVGMGRAHNIWYLHDGALHLRIPTIANAEGGSISWKWWRLSFKNDGTFVDTWDIRTGGVSTHIITWKEDRMNVITSQGARSTTTKYDKNKNHFNGSYLPGNINAFKIENLDTSIKTFALGPYIYTSMGWQSTTLKDWNAKPDLRTLLRIPTSSGVPFGEWEPVTFNKDLLEGLREFFIFQGMVVILTVCNGTSSIGHKRGDVHATYLPFNPKDGEFTGDVRHVHVGRISDFSLVGSSYNIFVSKGELYIQNVYNVQVYAFEGTTSDYSDYMKVYQELPALKYPG